MRRTEELNLSIQTNEQPRAGPSVEAMPTDPIPESLGSRWPAEESTTTASGLGSGERLVPRADGSVVMPRAMTEAAGALEANAGIVDAASESRAEKPTVLEEPTALPKASKGVVEHGVQPPSPLVVLPATEEDDEVEEIEHEESRPQAIRILCKQGDEVVVIEEEDTTRELRRLESTLSVVMKQIKVSTTSCNVHF